MPEQDPHAAASDNASPRRRYRITFLPTNQIVEVDPETSFDEHYGRPGSVLDIALHHGIDLDHACGGVCACSTCHVIVREGSESCGHPDEREEDQLDNASGVTSRSRLACQCVADGTQDLVIEIPEWNRNLAREPSKH